MDTEAARDWAAVRVEVGRIRERLLGLPLGEPSVSWIRRAYMQGAAKMLARAIALLQEAEYHEDPP